MGALHPAVAVPLSGAATSRLSWRPLTREDTDELDAIFTPAEVWEYDYEREPTGAFVERQLRLWDECGFGGCAIREHVQTRLVGIVGLAVATVPDALLPPVTVGWRFSPRVWGRGYATEDAAAVLDQAFTTMGLDRLGCVTNGNNGRSIAVAERLGMTVIGEVAAPANDSGAAVNAVMLQVSRDSWCARHDSRASS